MHARHRRHRCRVREQEGRTNSTRYSSYRDTNRLRGYDTRNAGRSTGEKSVKRDAAYGGRLVGLSAAEATLATNM